MAEDLILVLDAGTTSTRALVFERSGRVLAQHAEALTQYYPQPGWVEHDAAEILALSAAVLKRAAAGFTERIAALGITNQRETVLLWDKKTGAPLHRALVWQDRRTTPMCTALAAHANTIQAQTGLPLNPYFSATKIAWLLDQVDGARDAAKRGDILAGTIDSWLVWCWSGQHITDATNASRTLLYDLHQGTWSADLCAVFDIPMEILPKITDSAGPLATLHPDVLGRAKPICGLAGDQQAAAIGQSCLSPGMAKVTYGTGAFLLAHTGATPILSRHHLLVTVAWQIAGQRHYALEGSLFVAGSAVQWLRNSLGLITHAEELAALAASVPSTEGVVFVPAFAGLGAPWWDAQARGLLCGLTHATRKAHIGRAVLEAMSHQTADLLGAFAADGVSINTLRIDGGMARNDWMMDDLANVLQTLVERPALIETTAWGAAMLAMIGCGLAPSLEHIGAAWQAERRAEPHAEPKDIAIRRQDWALAIRRAQLSNL